MYKNIDFLIFIIIVLISSNLCIIDEQQQPIFTSQPVDVGPLFSGTRGILQCTASGTPTVQYRWLKDDKSAGNQSVLSNGGVFLIAQADRYRDVGVYQCIAENKLGSVLSNKAYLTVAYMDQIKAQYPTEIKVKLGHAAVIKMPKIFDAYPAPTIEWFAGGALIEPNAKFAITKDFNLVVLRCDKADEKSYYVEASSIHTGTKIRSRDIRLNVIDYNNQYASMENSNQYNGYDLNESYEPQQEEANVSDLEFVVKPANTIAKLNDNLVKFDCIVNSRRQPLDQLEINWYKDDQLIDFVKTKYHLSSRSLEIISVSDQDAGVYTCSAKYNQLASSAISQGDQVLSINASAKLDVYIKPTFKIQPENLIETDFGKTVTLKCEGIANPVANITWYKNAELIDFNKHQSLKLNESDTRLIINNISQSDQAIYQCFLSNEAGQISASTLIKIISFAPKFTHKVQNRTVYSDSNILISCGNVDGSPKPKITWTKVGSGRNLYKNKDQQYSDDQSSGSFQDDHGSEEVLNILDNGDLSIRNVGVKDQGWYKCEASNILGQISANLFLQVKRKTEIIEPPMNISVIKGQSALFKCTVSKEEDIDVEVKWKFNDIALDLTPITSSFSSSSQEDQNDDSSFSDNKYSNLKLFQNGTLQIIEAKNTDIGTYKCVVNSLNSAQAGNDSKTAYLNVVELPYAPFNLKAILNNHEKRSVNLTWQPSFDGNSQIIKYIIHARITLFDLSLVQYEQSSILNDWFVIKDNVYLDNTNYFYNSQQNQQQSSILWTIVNDLKPAYSYEFRISAVNGIGEGMPSRSSNNITIPEEVPDLPPQNLQAYSINSKTLNVQWQAPVISSWNGRLKGYKIAYSLSYPNSTWKYLTVEDQMQTSTNISDLIVWETYMIKVCAFNSKGFGRYSQPIRIRTKEGIPIRAPVNFKANSINSTCIRMSWSEPPAQFVNGIIQGYKLVYYEYNHSDSKQIQVINVNSINSTNTLARNYLSSSSDSDTNMISQENQYYYLMCNLSKFTTYTLSILCYTNSGDGPPTQPIQLKTLEDVPGEVNDIYFNNVYDTSIDVEWSPPSQPNGRILAYIISYRPAASSIINPNSNISDISLDNTKFERIVLDASQNNFTLKNLRSSTEYIIGIKAKTQAGDGVQKFTQIKSGVPPELPEPPKAIVLRTIGHTWIELEFIPGYNGKTSINKWIVEALELDNNNQYITNNKWYRVYEKSNAPNATKLTVSNLKPFTNYTLRMHAQNVKGISKPSQSTESFQTLADVPSEAPKYLTARQKSLFKNTTLKGNINLLVRWTPIATSKWNGIPLGYVLFVQECETNLKKRVEINFNMKFEIDYYLLRGLNSYKCYSLSVCAWNNVGLGPETDSIIVNKTSQSRPSQGPVNVNLYPINASSIKVTWSKLEQDLSILGGILTGYKIRYQPDISQENKIIIQDNSPITYYDDQDDRNKDNDPTYLSSLKPKEIFIKQRVGTDKYETDLNNLLSYTNYKIEISGCTRAGCGQYSLPVSLRTQEYLPSKPIDIGFTYVNLTSLQIEWRSPRYKNGNLKAFRIRYILRRYLMGNNGTFGDSKSVDQQATQWNYLYLTINQSDNDINKRHKLSIDGLYKMEYYIFEISANNSYGMGWGESARSIVYTIDSERRNKPDPPSKPYISKSSIKSSELTISWNTNSDNYSPIRYFTIQIIQVKDENVTDFCSNQTFTWQTVYLLKISNNLNSYRFNIRGRDKSGNLILKPNGRMYKFRISATNDVGSSEYSLESNIIQTKYERPMLQSYKFHAKPLTTSKIYLSWYELINTECKNDNDFLLKYKITYRQIGLPENDNLDSNIDNEIEVIIDYKNTTKHLINSTTNKEKFFNLNTFKDEKLRFESNKINFMKHEFELENSLFLSNGTYLFQLCGINQMGDSFKCTTMDSLVYIEDREPGKVAPTAYPLSIKAISSTQLNVTWKSMADNYDLINGNLFAYKLIYYDNDIYKLNKSLFDTYFYSFLKSSYKYEYVEDQSGNYYDMDMLDYEQNSDGVIQQDYIKQPEKNLNSDYLSLVNYLVVDSSTTNFVINSLSPYKNYSIYIQLINQYGESKLPHLPVLNRLPSVQTLESVPSQPAKLLFTYVSYNFLNLTWLRPKNPNGIILSYEYWYENLPQQNSNQQTKIIKQEVQNTKIIDANTVHISNLEPNTYYKFKVRCRTSIDWGPYIERIVRTGPKVKINSSIIIQGEDSNLRLTDYSDEDYNKLTAPLAPSKPIFTNINDTHSMLEWKSYSSDYEWFIVEIKYIQMPLSRLNGETPLDYQNYSFKNNLFEVYTYTNVTSLVLNKYDKNLNQHLLNSGAVSQSVAFCVFRVLSFNSVSISEPSEITELVPINKVASLSMSSASLSQMNNKQLISSGTSFLQFSYSSPWFLVTIALSSGVLIIIVILVMIVRGKNKKFLMNRKKRMNTLKMMKLNQQNQANMNQNQNMTMTLNKMVDSPYILIGSNVQDGSNTLTTNVNNTDSINDYSPNLDANNLTLMRTRTTNNSNNNNSIYLADSNQHLISTNTTNSLSRNSYNTNNLHELRKSKRGGGVNSDIFNYTNTGTIKTATYVSPNGTLSKINIISNDDLLQNNQQGLLGNNLTLLKKQQINGLNNPRNLKNIIGLTNMAQPNDYCTSGKIGSILNNFDQLPEATYTGKSDHYLIPCSTSANDVMDLVKQQNNYGGQSNINFNYSPTDGDNDTNPITVASQLLSNPPNTYFDRNNVLNTVSQRKIFTTNSFGRQQANNCSKRLPPPKPKVMVPNNFPPPPPSLLTSQHQDETDMSNQNEQVGPNYNQLSSFDERRSNLNNNYASTKSRTKPTNLNVYYEHDNQHLYQLQQQQQQQQQPMYHLHQAPPSIPSPPPPPPKLNSPVKHRSKSPVIHKKPLQMLNIPNQPVQLKIKNQSIATAASSTAEALGALATAATSMVQPQNRSSQQQPHYFENTSVTNRNSTLNNQNDNPDSQNQQTNNNNTSSISVSLSGDRVVMSNVAGSRKPLTSGYTSFI